jgi:hypothetical protein
MWRSIGLCAAMAILLCGSSLLADEGRDGKDGKDEFVGGIWSYTLTRGEEKTTGQFRVNDREIFKGPKKVGTVNPDGGETTITITDWPEMNGVAHLRKNRRHPAGASGTLKKTDGSEWAIRITFKDG